MGARTLRKSLREGWWEDVEAADSARTGERRDCEASPTLASLRALAEAKIQPTVYAGSSAGALAPILTPRSLRTRALYFPDEISWPKAIFLTGRHV
jgi:hypothetical protein